MLRFIRLLGGALGVILAITLAGLSGTLSEPTTEGRVLLLAWIVAWSVAGFAIMPYITVTPARWLMRAVTDMSTDEFVAAVVGLILGLLMGFLLGLPLTSLEMPMGILLPVGISIVLALGMMGLAVAKRHDLLDAAFSVAASDGTVASEELSELRLISNFLWIDAREFNVIRKRWDQKA